MKRNTFFLCMGALFALLSCSGGADAVDNGEGGGQTAGVKTATLGNGKYTMTNFMVADEGTVNEKINQNLAVAQNYIKGLVNGFSETLKAKYSFDLIQEDTFKPTNWGGFDNTIINLRDACKPIINEIVENIGNDINRNNFFCYYKALSNEVYRYGFGGESNFQKSSNEFNPKEDYENNKLHAAIVWDNNNTNPPIADFEGDINNNQCKEITDQMNILIKQAANNMNNGITANDLRNVVNLSFNINSLDSMHDYYGYNYDKHQSCDPVENEPIINTVN